MVSTARRTTLRSLLVVGTAVALLAGCQTGNDPAGEETPSPTTTATATAEPEETTPPDEPEETAGPVVNGTSSIISPTPGETIAGPTVTVTGEATAFEATLNYHVLVAGTEEVVVGPDYATAGANGEIGPFAIELTLDPGEYTVQVWEPDMSEGEGTDGPRNLVEVTFTVT